MTATSQEILVSDAFSRQSSAFDEIDERNSLLLWIRNRVRNEVLQYITPGASMLELNCGTGLDAVFFAQRGFKVLATDNADGMLEVLSKKITTLGLEDTLACKKCSFNNLEQLGETQFDYVFSNFGGLNCTDNLAKVLHDIDKQLKPGGYFTLVIMPPVCPWEIATLFKGYFKTAFRRFKQQGARSHLEGVYFNSYYYTPSYIINNVDSNYKLCALRGLSAAVPPPFIENFCERHPKLFSALEHLENSVWDKWPFNRWCDHFMITMQKQ
jgi:ubiquinone/menaquinone biosynthesis C-methylase UbiE